jgi:hypothetical protein
MVSRQLELGLENQPGMKPGRKRGRAGRANWWFEQMRDVVDHARDWPAAPLPAQIPRPTATGPGSAAPPPKTTPHLAISRPPPAPAVAPSTPEPKRWRFVRTRRLIWE